MQPIFQSITLKSSKHITIIVNAFDSFDATTPYADWETVATPAPVFFKNLWGTQTFPLRNVLLFFKIVKFLTKSLFNNSSVHPEHFDLNRCTDDGRTPW